MIPWLRDLVSALAAVLALWANLDYLLAVRRRIAHPRLATWCIWTAALAVGAAGAGKAGQLPGVALSAAGCISGAVVLVSGWRHGDREFSRLDKLAVAGGSAGVALLAVAFARPELVPVAAAVAVSVATDLIAFTPTFANARAGNEPPRPYLIYTAGGAAALAVADFAVPAGVIYPAYELAVCLAAATLAVAGQRNHSYRSRVAQLEEHISVKEGVIGSRKYL